MVLGIASFALLGEAMGEDTSLSPLSPQTKKETVREQTHDTDCIKLHASASLARRPWRRQQREQIAVRIVLDAAFNIEDHRWL